MDSGQQGQEIRFDKLHKVLQTGLVSDDVVDD